MTGKENIIITTITTITIIIISRALGARMFMVQLEFIIIVAFHLSLGSWPDLACPNAAGSADCNDCGRPGEWRPAHTGARAN